VREREEDKITDLDGQEISERRRRGKNHYSEQARISLLRRRICENGVRIFLISFVSVDGIAMCWMSDPTWRESGESPIPWKRR
jgi:hypothetical protein